jgi:hypothetical protein
MAAIGCLQYEAMVVHSSSRKRLKFTKVVFTLYKDLSVTNILVASHACLARSYRIGHHFLGHGLVHRCSTVHQRCIGNRSERYTGIGISQTHITKVMIIFDTGLLELQLVALGAVPVPGEVTNPERSWYSIMEPAS